MKYPRARTAGFGAWTVSKFYRGASFRRENGTLSINVGEYDPVLGRSYSEIAAISRSQHRSQASGTLQPLGVRLDYLQREATLVPAPEDPKAERSIFDGMDTTWTRFRGHVSGHAHAALASLPTAILAARATYEPYAPGKAVPALARVQRHLLAIPAGADTTIVPTPAAAPLEAISPEACISNAKGMHLAQIQTAWCKDHKGICGCRAGKIVCCDNTTNKEPGCTCHGDEGVAE